MCFGDKRRFGLGCSACRGVINPDFEREIRKRILPPRHPSSRWISIMKSKSGFHGFWLRNTKRDSQNCSRAVIPLHFRLSWEQFLISILDEQNKNGKKENKNRFLSYEIRFRILRSFENPNLILILKSKSRFANRAHPLKQIQVFLVIKREVNAVYYWVIDTAKLVGVMECAQWIYEARSRYWGQFDKAKKLELYVTRINGLQEDSLALMQQIWLITLF